MALFAIRLLRIWCWNWGSRKSSYILGRLTGQWELPVSKELVTATSIDS